MGEKILVFIPMYNCALQIPRVIAQFTPEICSHFTEILVVDNGSKDEGLAACRESLKRNEGRIKWTLVQNKENYSLGGSHKVAFNYALDNKFDYVAILHGDDQGSIADLIPLLESGKHRQTQCLLGSRFMKGSRLVNYSWIRILGNKIFNFLFSVVTGERLYDLGAGLNLFRKDFLESRFYLRFPDALTFNFYLTLYMTGAKGVSKEFFPISWREDDQISNAKLANMTIKLFKILARYVFSKEKFLSASHETARNYSFQIIAQH